MSGGAFLATMDPPWSADAGGGGKGANEHYPLAGVDGIAAAVRLSGLWRDDGPALVWMWATSSALVAGDAHALANRLRLRVCAGFIWAKVDDLTRDALAVADGVVGHRRDVLGPELVALMGPEVVFAPPARMGLGQWSRCEHEHLLVCRRGDIAVPAASARQRSVIYAPRGVHSAKPEAAWHVIETTSRATVGDVVGVEFFCRTPRTGWTGWGHINGAEAGAVIVEG